jgi:hypothetical protein
MWEIKGKPNKYNTVGTVPKSNRKFTETRVKIETPKHMHNRSIYWLGTFFAR